MHRIYIVFLLSILTFYGCTGWRRVTDLDRPLDVDRAECRIAAQQMSVERDNREVKTLGVGPDAADKPGSRAAKKHDYRAAQRYYMECMRQKGWTLAGNAEFVPVPDGSRIVNGNYVVLNSRVSRDGEVVKEGYGHLYRIGAHQLKGDVEARLRGRKVGDIVVIDRSMPIIPLGSSAGNPEPYHNVGDSDLQISIEIVGIYKYQRPARKTHVPEERGATLK